MGQRYSWRRRRDGHHVLDAIGTRRAGIDEPRHAIRQTQRRRLLGAGSVGMDVDQPWDDELAARVECLHGLGRGGAQPTPNPVGLWTINGNGFPGVLSIPSLDPQGTLGAGSTVYGQHIFGFWDDPVQKLTCMRVSAPTDPTTFGDPLFVGR